MTDNDSNNFPEKVKNFGTNDRPIPITPERHGCVTAWLVLMLIGSSSTCLLYFFEDYRMEKLLKISSIAVGFIIIIGIFNVVFSIMLLSWKKAGFYGFTVTTIILFITNICIKLSLIPTVLSLFGIGLLYGILQIKKGGRSAWYYLK